MSSYTTMLTPPSSSEDSPPVYFVASPSSTSFQGPEGYDNHMDYSHVYINRNITTGLDQQPSKYKY